MYKINKQKCIGCGACTQICPNAIKMGENGKAEITNQEKLKECGGKNICAMKAIEKIEE